MRSNLSSTILFVSVFSFMLNGPSGDCKSLFESVIEKNGGAVPFPIEKFLELFPAKANALIPNGRSLQKDHASAQNPRFLRSSYFDAGFFGFSEKAEQIEVISWDPDQKLFRFFIVDGYSKGKTPTIKPVTDSQCFACHQNQGPIFPRGPWREMLSRSLKDEDNGRLVRELKKYHRKEYLGVQILDTEGGSGSLVGDPLTFDDSVRNANRMLQKGRVCRSACVGDSKCAGVLLQAALEYHLLGLRYSLSVFDHPEKQHIVSKLHFSPNGMWSEVYDMPNLFSDYKEGITRNWPKDEFAYRSSILPDRDPFADPPVAFRVVDKGDITFDENKTSKLAVFNDDQEVAVREGASSLIDPKTLRPLVGHLSKENAPYFVYGIAAECFHFEDSPQHKKDIELLGQYLMNRKDIEAAIASPRVQSALKAWPIEHNSLMRALLEAVGVTSREGHSCYPEDGLKTDKDKFIELETVSLHLLDSPRQDHSVAKFRKYCGACHESEGSLKLPLTDIQSLKTFVRPTSQAKRTSLMKIRNGSMPPASFLEGNAEIKKEWESDRAALEKILGH